jgi:hypothetical protein
VLFPQSSRLHLPNTVVTPLASASVEPTGRFAPFALAGEASVLPAPRCGAARSARWASSVTPIAGGSTTCTMKRYSITRR